MSLIDTQVSRVGNKIVSSFTIGTRHPLERACGRDATSRRFVVTRAAWSRSRDARKTRETASPFPVPPLLIIADRGLMKEAPLKFKPVVLVQMKKEGRRQFGCHHSALMLVCTDSIASHSRNARAGPVLTLNLNPFMGLIAINIYISSQC
jgi:hypothetical protein